MTRRADGADAAGDIGSAIGVRDAMGDGGGAGSVIFAAAGLLVAPDAPLSTATTAPTGATSPAATRISPSTPAVVAGTSIDTLSVSISNRLSPGLTASPIDLNHVVILPSATVSPSCGIKMSMRALSSFNTDSVAGAASPLPACGERSEFAHSSCKFRVRGPLRG